MYKSVIGAWMVLGPNAENQLHVQFDPSTKMDADASVFNERKPGAYFIENEGLAYFGAFDDDGKWWSSNAPYINQEFGAHVIEITIVMDHTRYSGAITVPFAKKILEDFNIPFKVVEYTIQGHRNFAFKQIESPIGKYCHTKYGEVRVISDESYMSWLFSECYRVRLANGKLRYLSFNDLTELYQGMTWDQFHKDWNRRKREA